MYNYDVGCHDEASTAIQNADNAIRGEASDCDRIAQQHLLEWQSHLSREAYNGHKAKWDQALENMQNILAAAAPALRRIHEKYEHNDRHVAKTVS